MTSENTPPAVDDSVLEVQPTPAGQADAQLRSDPSDADEPRFEVPEGAQYAGPDAYQRQLLSSQRGYQGNYESPWDGDVLRKPDPDAPRMPQDAANRDLLENFKEEPAKPVNRKLVFAAIGAVLLIALAIVLLVVTK